MHTTYQFNSYFNYLSRFRQQELIARHGSIRHHRKCTWTSRVTLGEAVASFSSLEDFSCQVFDENESLAWSDLAVLRLRVVPRNDATSVQLEVFAVDSGSAEAVLDRLKVKLVPFEQRPRLVQFDWYYRVNHHTHILSQEEAIDDVLSPHAYPWLPGGLEAFTASFLASREAVAIFFGPPGVGKTRLIRHLLGEHGQGQNAPFRVLHAADSEVYGSDDFFVHFLTGDYGALVMEDADHLLDSRGNGNRQMHRLLGASDGLFHSRNRRLIFSSNLPSHLAIDDALVRPGRCFGCFAGRRLSAAEALDVMADLSTEFGERERARLALLEAGARDHSLAEVYAAVRKGKNGANGPELSSSAGHAETGAPSQQGEHDGYPSPTERLGLRGVAADGAAGPGGIGAALRVAAR